MFRFRDGGPRRGVPRHLQGSARLRTPAASTTTSCGRWCTPLEREADAPRPAFLDTKPVERTPEETARYWVFQLRDLAGHQWGNPGYPQLFSTRRTADGGGPVARDRSPGDPVPDRGSGGRHADPDDRLAAEFLPRSTSSCGGGTSR